LALCADWLTGRLDFGVLDLPRTSLTGEAFILFIKAHRRRELIKKAEILGAIKVKAFATGGDSDSELFCVPLKSRNHTLFSFELELRWELNIEGEVEVAPLTTAFDGHAFILEQLAGLRTNLFVDGYRHSAAIKRLEGAGDAIEGFEQRDLLFENQVVPLALVVRVLKLPKLDNQVGGDVTGRLVAHFLEDQLRALGKARLYLNLLAPAFY